MRQSLLLFSSLAFSVAGWAGVSPAHNYPTTGRVAAITTEVPAVPQLLSDILEVIGYDGEFELKEADVLNLEASVSHGKKYILYNPQYIAWLNSLTHNKWATMTLLAHEVGHHVKGHTKRRSGSKPRLELQADEYAGYILQQLGASLQQAQEVMLHVASEKGSRTHPSRTARLQAIQKGWQKALVATAADTDSRPNS